MLHSIVRRLLPCAILAPLLVAACGPTCPPPPPQPCGGVCGTNQVCIDDVCKYLCQTNLDCERIDGRIPYCSPDHLCDPAPAN